MLLLSSASAQRDARICQYAEHALRLPYADRASYRVLQGNEGAFSHTGFDRFAWDFLLPIGDMVVAAEGGIVAEVMDGYAHGGNDRSLADRANLIVIDHGDAHFSLYQHLAHRSAVVREGQIVVRGQAIARSGNTGYSTRPHLHFEVIDHRNRSLPVCFASRDRIPREGRSYRAMPLPIADRPPRESVLPRDAFAENGVLLTSDIPARRAVGPMLEFTAQTTRPAEEAVVFLMTRDTSAVVRHVRVPITSRTFHARLSLARLDGPLDFAIALSDRRDGPYHSEFSVPYVVRSAEH